ncbi:MAG: putative ABC transporter ATP-binding protein YheS [Prosthecobacter sp.]|nr:putative ABC transporter ATP-binding protein YheS [Prosthecobacter sp.]
MLSVHNVSKTYAGRTLFSGVSFHINRGEKIGLIGPNGAGKSTLFSLLLRESTPDDGQVTMEKGLNFGFLPQESAPVDDVTVLQLATGHVDEHHRWELEPKAKRILKGLAFRESDFDRNARTLSGGWVMRAHLARLLVQEPDLLLLDEPTNHLDLESLLWFQAYLQTYPGAILMISHDREFLNALCDTILEIAHSKVIRYRGNYDDYLREKAAREEQMQSAFENQQREIAKLQQWADRFKAKANFASRAQDKLKMIDRMERVDAPQQAAKQVKFRFPQPPRSGQRVLTLKNLSFGYGQTPVYEDLDFEVERGQRLVLVGPNGAGKSTLLKLLAGALTPQSGRRELGHNVKPGYFAQYRGDVLNMRHTVLQSAMDLPSRPGEQLARTLLGSFLFHGDDVFKPVGVLSGGEKSRLALVRLLLDPPNLLLMDEPTTHLDMGSIDALIQALEDYEGTLVFISHDVHFIRAMARSVLHIAAGVLTPYAGDYQYYLDKTRSTSAREALTASLTNAQPASYGSSNGGGKNISSTADGTTGGAKTKEQKRAEAEARNARSRIRKELEEKVSAIEQRLAGLEKRKLELVELLQDGATYADAARFRALSEELEQIEPRIAQETTAWEKAAEELERQTTANA